MTDTATLDSTQAASTAAPPAISVQGLSHTYKPIKKQRSSRRHKQPVQDAALDAVDLQVNTGEIFALLGPNGSGKSTLLRILATVQTARHSDTTTNNPSTGTATIFGIDIAAEPAKVRRHLGVVFQSPALDLKLTAYENLRIHGKLYGLSNPQLDDAVKASLDSLGMAERMNDHVESFSGGMRRRVEIAKALLTKPKLLLMDEASAGLDLAIQRDIWTDLRKLVRETGLTVLLTTHLMHEAELADRVAVMSSGKVVAVDTPDNLVGKVGGQVLTITPANGTSDEQLLEQVRAELSGKLSNSELSTHQGSVVIEHPDAAELIHPLSVALASQASSFRLGRPTLADAYLKLTGQALGN